MAFNWIAEYMDRMKEHISTKFEMYEVSQYLGEQYTEAAQVVAYEDSWNIVEALGNGDFIGEDEKAMLRNDKINLMMEILNHPVKRKGKEMEQVMDQVHVRVTRCPLTPLF